MLLFPRNKMLGQPLNKKKCKGKSSRFKEATQKAVEIFFLKYCCQLHMMK